MIRDALYPEHMGSVTQSFGAVMKKKPSMENGIPTREFSFEVVFRATPDGRGKFVPVFPAGIPQGIYVDMEQLGREINEAGRLHSEKKRKQKILNKTRVFHK